MAGYFGRGRPITGINTYTKTQSDDRFRDSISGDMLPDSDSIRDIGSTSKRWAQGWFDDVTADTADINGGTIDGTVIGGSTPAAISGTDLTLSGGVYLGGTGAANKLDDYEEGTFTPTLSGYTGVTGTLQGKYVKIGQMVFCHISMTITALTYSGNSRITGWPFTPSNTIDNHVPHGTIGTGTALNVDPHLYHMAFYDQTANLYLYNRNTGSPLSGNNYQVGILGINVVYQAS